MEIIEAKVSDLLEIEQLIRKVWEPTYRHIVPQAQIGLMEEKMHRVSAYVVQHPKLNNSKILKQIPNTMNKVC